MITNKLKSITIDLMNNKLKDYQMFVESTELIENKNRKKSIEGLNIESIYI
jgi:hypothetical protein